MHTTGVRSLTVMNDVDLNYRMDIPDHEMRKMLREDDCHDLTRYLCHIHGSLPKQFSPTPRL
ncbi:hypothetical protein BYT27DRAFT_7199338, partial [Phlegmacium glaucopus]